MLFRVIEHYRDDDFIKNVSANEKILARMSVSCVYRLSYTTRRLL